MAFAIEHLAELGGGIVVVDGLDVVAEFAARRRAPRRRAARGGHGAEPRLQRGRARLGWTGATPFLTMSFLALSVIPSLKITDRGLVDVDRFELVPLAL